MDGLRITVEPLADVAAAAALWRELEPRADGSFFTSWLWVGTWLEATAIEPLLVTAHDAVRPVAAGLFAGAARGRRLLHETGSAAWDRLTIEYNDLLVARDAARDPRPDCLAALVGQATREIGLGGVERRWLAAAAHRGLPARVIARRPTFAIGLVPPDGAGAPLLARLGRNTRAAIRHSLRALGPVEGRAAASLGEAHDWLDALIARHQDHWQARGQPGAFADPRIRDFHHALVERGWASGAVELFAVSGPGGPFAHLLSFCHRDVVHAYQAGLAGDLGKRLKPGLVAHYMCAEHHARRGARAYDLMAGDARYKRNLGEPSGELVWLAVYARRSTAVAAELRRLTTRLAARLRRAAA